LVVPQTRLVFDGADSTGTREALALPCRSIQSGSTRVLRAGRHYQASLWNLRLPSQAGDHWKLE